MRFPVSTTLIAVASCTLLGAAAPCALADETSVFGSVRLSTGHTGATFGALLEYQSLTPTTGELNISIENMTPLEVGGYLTGLAFRFDSVDPMASATLIMTSDPDFLDTGPTSASPFGEFDAGCAVEANWLGGGNPSAGIGAGESASFRFAVAASDAGMLSVEDFARGMEYPSIVVRFRGLAEGGSDKVPGRGLTCDWNDDGFVNSQDFFDFLKDFFNLEADYNLNGITNSKDFFDFMRCFFEA